MGRTCTIVLLALLLLGASSARGDDRLVLTTTDYSSGSLAELDALTSQANTNILNIHGDATVRSYRGRVYVINRKGQDNILVLGGDALATPLLQFSVGNDTNPQDIAFVSGTKAYVARLEAPGLLVVNPATGDSLGSIDLSFAADADGFAEASSLVIHERRLFVTCQRLNQDAFFSPTEYSTVVVVDTDTDAVVDMDASADGVQGIRLQGVNPTAQVQVGARLFLACTGLYGAQDGGVEAVDLASGVTEGIVLGEDALEGDIGAITMASGTEGYAVVGDASFVNSVRPFNVVTGLVGTALTGTSGGYLPAIGAWAGRLYVSDQGSFSDPAAAGVLVFSQADGSLVAGPVSTGLPPNAQTYVRDSDWADVDMDGDVDFTDFLGFARAYETSSGDSLWDGAFDSDSDGTVDFDDFLALVRYYGK